MFFSFELAKEVVHIISPYVERAPHTRKYLEAAEMVLASWEEKRD
jgi:hypothetical protein